MVILGITGGIGSGKSFISSLFREQLNVPVYDCDTEAKHLMNEDKALQQQLKQLVGTHVYKAGKLQKSVLADYLFSDQQPDHPRRAGAGHRGGDSLADGHQLHGFGALRGCGAAPHAAAGER